jgi:hypothetical protein
MLRTNFPNRKNQRKAEGEKRAEAYAQRSPAEQLALVASRRGESKRETGKLRVKVKASA